MSGPVCHHCGKYLTATQNHDEQACEREHRRQIYARGVAKARAELAAARAALRKDTT